MLKQFIKGAWRTFLLIGSISLLIVSPHNSYATDSLIINGTTVNPEGSGFVKLHSSTGGCSGTLLSNDWVLTARHCVDEPDITDPSKVTVEMGSQKTKAALVVTNIHSAGTLIRLKESFAMNGSKEGYRQDIYRGDDAELIGETLSCYGYGNNTLGGGFGTLRTAELEVTADQGRCTTNCYVLKTNDLMQITSAGDSGSSCLLKTANKRLLTGIHWGSPSLSYGDQVFSTIFRGYALHHVYKERFGGTVVTGDFNNDGYKDLAVGFSSSPVASVPWAGVVKIYRGTSSEPQIWQTLTQSGLGSDETGDRFGFALAVGDFNGDGNDDLAVGAPGEVPGSDPWSGYVFLFKGTSSGLTAWQGLDQAGLGANEADDRFGYALISGDFDGDGKDDLAVGAPGEAPQSSTESGYVFLFKGSPNGVQPWQGVDQGGIGSNEAGDRFGYSLAAGDFNKDGKDDLVVGAPGEIPGESQFPLGYVFIYNGTNTGIKPWQGFSPLSGKLVSDETTRLFGWSLTTGDFDGNGYVDLAVGAPQELGGNRAGAVFVYTSNLFGIFPSRTITQGGIGSNELGDWFGASVATGDLNGDGYDELVVGTPAEAPGNDPESGYVFIFKGISSVTVLEPWFGLGQDNWEFNEKGDWFGGALAVVDFQNDPRSDAKLVVGAPGEVSYSSSIPGAVFFIEVEKSGGIENTRYFMLAN